MNANRDNNILDTQFIDLIGRLYGDFQLGLKPQLVKPS